MALFEMIFTLAMMTTIHSYFANAQPALTSFSLNMTPPEQLILTFSSDVDPSSCNISLLTLQSAFVAQPDASITFSNGFCESPTNSTSLVSVEVLIGDWNSVQYNIKVATNIENTYIALSSGFIQDQNGTDNVEISSNSALKVAVFQENTNPPSVTNLVLDLNLGLFTLSLSEAVDLLTLDITGFRVHYLSGLNEERGNITLASTTRVSTFPTGVISFHFTDSDFLLLKTNSASNYSLSIRMGSLIDGSGMSNFQQTEIVFDTVIPDMIPPHLDVYSLDLNTGVISLSFSEPLDIQTLNPDRIAIVGASRNSFNLAPSTVVSSIQMSNRLLTLTFTYAQLNLLKLYTSSGGITLVLNSSAVSDTSGNPVTSIPTTNSFKPDRIIPDTTPPRLVQFIPGPPEEQQVTYIFDEFVSPDSWTGASIVYVLNDSAQMEHVYTGFSKGTLSSETSDMITYTFTDSEFSAPFSEHYADAYNSGSISLQVGPGLVSDLNGNRLIAPPAPLIFMTGPDTERPRLINFILDMNTGEIIMTFSEPVSIVSGSQVVLQERSTQPSATYIITGNTISPQDPSAEITLTITRRDLNAIKLNPNLVTSVDNTYLVLSETFANDSSGNMLVEDLNGTQASQFIPDTTSPDPTSVSMDLDHGLILIQFSEPVLQTFDFSGIFITRLSQITPSSHSLSGSTINSTAEMNTLITVLLSETVLNTIKNDVTVCTGLTDCYLFFNSASVSDLFGNTLSSQGIAIVSLLPDTTQPELITYSVDLNQGRLLLIFSEPMAVSSLDVTGLRLVRTTPQSNLSLEIDSGLLDARELNTILSLTLRPNSLNQLKLANALDNVALAIDPDTISDTSRNMIREISSSSPLQPSLVIPDTTPPLLIDFIASLPEERQITLIFNEPVNSSTWDRTKITISFNTRAGSSTYTNFNQGNATPVYSDTIEYLLTETEFNSTFAQHYTDAFYNGYLALSVSNGFILDLSFNPSLSTLSPLLSNNGSDFPDLIRPTLTSFNFDLNSGTLEMTFSENITNIRVPGQVQLLSNPISNTSYTLLSEGSIIQDQMTPNIVALVMSISDLNDIKSIDNLATSAENTFLILLENFASDENDNLLVPLQEGLQVSSFFPDTERPQLLSFDVDMNSEVLSLHFNEPISTSIQYDQIFLTGSLQNTPGGINVTGSSAIFTSSRVRITLSTPVFNSVKADTNICTSRSNCLIFLTESSFSDTSGNLLLPPPTSSLVTNFIADSGSPELTSYSIDLDTGQMELIFTEPILASSFDSFGVRLQSDAGTSITLSDVVTLNLQNIGLSLTLLIGSMSLNQLKLLHATESVHLALEGYTITDTAGNMVTQIPPTSALPPSVIVQDTTQPSLINFIPGPPEDMQVTFVFDEYVNTSTWDGTRASLTLTTPDEESTYFIFVEGELTPQFSDTVMYNFSSTEFNASISALYAEAYANYSVSLYTQGGLVSDLNSNALLGLRALLVFSQVDNIRPTLLNFTLDLDLGTLKLTFSEDVIIRSVSGHVRLQNDPTQPTSVYTLTRNGTLSIQAEVAVIFFDNLDLNNIKYSMSLATSLEDSFLFLLEPFALDTSGNILDFQQNATGANFFLADASGPEVVMFDLDLDSNIMSIQFNEPVRVATFNPMAIVFTDRSIEEQSNKEVVPLTSVEVIAEFNALLTSFRILLGVTDSVSLKSAPICYTRDNCFASFQSGLISDIYNNPSLASNISVPVNTLLPDVTPPRLVAFAQFDLDSGLFTLVFSEPVNSSSTEFTDVQFINNLRNPTVNVTLSEGFSTPDHVEIDFHMTRDDLNMVKISLMLCTGRENCWIRLPSFFINDIGMNPFLHSNYQPDAQASFHQPLSFIPDTTPPILEEFSIDMNEGILVLSFSEVVLLDSFSPNTVTLLGSRDGNIGLTLSGQSTFTRSPEGDEITVQLTLSDINSLKAQDLYNSVDDSFIIISEGLLDTSRNTIPTTLPVHALQVSTYQGDITQPLLVSFDRFNREIGSIVLSFNEPVIIDTVQLNHLTLLSAPSSTSRYTLTGGEVTYADDRKLSLSITFSRQDRINIKTITDLAINGETVFVSLLEGFVNDTSGNICEDINEAHPLGLAGGQFIEDTVRASLIEYTLDLNAGTIILSFDDVLNASSIEVTSLVIQISASFLDDSTSHTLNEDSNIPSDNSDVITLSLSEGDLNVLKLDLSLAIDASSTFISFDSSFAVDIEGKHVVGITQDSAVMANTYIPDSSSPFLSSFNLDMDSGLLQLTFSEPVLVSSANTNQIVFRNNKPSSQTAIYSLLNSFVLTVPMTSLTILINITYDDLNQLKGTSDLAGNTLNTFISVTNNFVSDTSGNKIEESSIMVTDFVQDTTPPELLYFDLQLESNTGAILTLQFSEAVAVHENSSLFFTVQNNISNPSIALALSSIDTIRQPQLDQVEITLRLAYTTRLLTDDTIGSSVDTLFISLAPGGITDHNNNDAIPVLSSNAKRVRLLARPCFDMETFSDIVSGTCRPCPVECVEGCTGSQVLAGNGGCNMCYVLLLTRNGEQESCLPAANGCPPGYFISTNNPDLSSLAQTVCEPCHEDCSTCTSGSQNDCQGCNSAYRTSQPNGPIVQCVRSCSGLTDSTLCQTCHPQCNGCTGPANTDCVQCLEDSMLVQGSDNVRCIPRCDGNKYLIEGPPGEYTCQPCHPECSNCTGPTNSECVQCRNVNNTLVRGSMCIDTCPDESFLAQANQCLPCHQQCAGCSGPTNRNCTVCQEDSLIITDGITECVPHCSFGMEFSTSEQACKLTLGVIVAMVVCCVLACLLVAVVVGILICLLKRYRKNKRKIPFERRRPTGVVFMSATSLKDPDSHDVVDSNNTDL